MDQERRMKCKNNLNNRQNNLNKEESLIVLNQALITIVSL